MRRIYYGRVSTLDGQTAASQYADAAEQSIDRDDVFIDEGVSGYHVPPSEREQWQHVERDLRKGGVLVVRWLDRISRRYDELHATMQRLITKGVRVECTLNGMVFDGQETDPTRKAVRDAILAFMAAQGEADYRNRREMQARGIAVAKEAGKYKGRKHAVDYAEVRAYHAEHGGSVRALAEHFGVGVATVSRALNSANPTDE
ncbi:recombinase family protein [Burkholderia ubonensis]|uniref:Resolvase n=1 Tax=Burkholderia ubonensis TaxID=101571 RepID=A0A124XXP7_9BURK|nr:recombinase family protein [Burkholderia ubonensis]MXN73389.1 recombinase family protein [Burkholderia sp. 4701]MXN81281.1 recombinase family protein [Burkholderia sp. 4812]KVG35640.1 resolvase [Burkholderia ubonensis]KVP40989.1 resolvase [Burkholderia ubonensis]KVP53629.1 resolvase [Burkholderia ubonensis]